PSLSNSNPTVVNLGNLGLTSGGEPIAQMYIAQEADGRIYGIVPTHRGPKIAIYDFGYSPENTPQPVGEFSIGNQTPIHVRTLKTCLGWTMLIVNRFGSVGTLTARLGNSLTNSPSGTTGIGATGGVAGNGFFPVYENGRWYLFYQLTNTRSIGRIDVGPDLYNPTPQTLIQTWPTGPNAEGYGWGAARDDEGNLHFFSWGVGNAPLRRLTFRPNCGETQTIYRDDDTLALQFNRPGTYFIDRCVTYANGRIACYTAPISIGGTAVAFDFENPCAGKPVQFTDQSVLSTPGALYRWDFGDGSEGSTLFNPSHTFDLAGNYAVTLTVSDPAGCVNSLTRDVRVKQTPRADFFITPLGGCVGSPIRFSDNSTFADGDIVLRAWDMGDNIQIFDSTEFNYSYAKGGTYRVRLTAYGDNQCSDSRELFVAAPGAYFETTSACAQLATRFTAYANYYGDAVSAWKWNFGDPASGAANVAFQQLLPPLTHNRAFTTSN
ncbi:MAG: PKD domain-containing protein, partial [Bacteroidia bacterium]|nr:PKD domain-containing protein [Bacteroidia bacterium]